MDDIPAIDNEHTVMCVVHCYFGIFIVYILENRPIELYSGVVFRR